MINIFRKLRLIRRGLPILLILLPCLLVFVNFLKAGNLTFGDAPFFYKEGLKELVGEPSVWTQKGNALGGINNFLFISPLMFKYGLIGTVFSLSNDVLIRLFFYFPAVIFAIGGIYLLAGYLKIGGIAKVFSILIYLFSTYFLLVIDGGQVGVALAYGFFPLTVYFSRKLVDSYSLSLFVLSLLSFFILSVIDPRIAVIAILTIFLWCLIEFVLGKRLIKTKNFWIWLAILIFLVFLNGYWLFPFFKLSVMQDGLPLGNLPRVTWLQSLLLFSPHWPLNLYGVSQQPFLAFFFLPVFIFAQFILKKNKLSISLFVLYLIFSFLAKGNGWPFGEIYQKLAQFVLGSIFRDSTKFYIPTVLFASLLIGGSITLIVEKIHNRLFKILFVLMAYIYFLWLVFPALSGKLNFVLSKRGPVDGIKEISEYLAVDNESFRSIWFPEKYPLAYETRQKAAIDAKSLVFFRPFASLNVGSYDLFNYMRQGNWQDWYRLLGIKYLVLSKDPRMVEYNEQQVNEWDDFENFLATQSGLVKPNVDTNIPFYKLDNSMPEIFGVNKLLAVVGSDDIYEKISKHLPSFVRSNQAFIFTEDGVADPLMLLNKEPSSVILLFNDKNKRDLTLSFLKKYFISPSLNDISDWKICRPEEYLECKYQFLIRGINTKEFDYAKGIAFSTVKNEEISFEIKTPKEDAYYLVARVMGRPGQSKLLLKAFGNEYEVDPDEENLFEWYQYGPFNLKKQKNKITFINSNGISILNTVALIPKDEYELALNQSELILKRYQQIFLEKERNISSVIMLLNDEHSFPIEFQKYSENEFSLTLPNQGHWIVFSDRFNPLWKLFNATVPNKGYPFYSAVNGFYFDPGWKETKIFFEGQREFRWGIWISLVSLLTFGIFSLLLTKKEK